MDGKGGCTDCYVKVQCMHVCLHEITQCLLHERNFKCHAEIQTHQVKLGAKTSQTPVVPDDLNPTFSSEV